MCVMTEKIPFLRSKKSANFKIENPQLFTKNVSSREHCHCLPFFEHLLEHLPVCHPGLPERGGSAAGHVKGQDKSGRRNSAGHSEYHHRNDRYTIGS